MGKKLGLVAAVVALFAVIGGITYFAVTRMRRQETTGLASVPRDVLGVVSINVDRIRNFPPAQRLRQLAMSQPDVVRDWAPFVATCGFDPMDRLDTLTFAWDRTAFTEHSPVPGLSVVALGRVNTVEVMRCLAAAARVGRGTPSSVVPLAPINGHPVLTFVSSGGSMSANDPRLAIVSNGIVLGTAASVPRTVNVVDHREPGADRNDQLRGALGALNGELYMYGVLDVPALLQSLPPEALNAVQTLNVPGFSSAVTQLLTIQSSGLGLMRQGDGLRAAAVITYRTPAEATNAAAVAQQALGLVRLGMMSEVMREEQRYMRRVTEAQPLDPTLVMQVAPVQQLFTLVNSLPERVRVRADGSTVHVELDVSGAEVTVIEAGSRALAATETSMDRVRSLQYGAPSPAPTF
ncbi:MAG: hypothetical protein WCJ30_14325 [Deltaproteobacteria bacterium]